MKILFITNNYTPYSGGVVSSINATISQLQKVGHEVELITFSFLPDHDDPAHVRRIPSLAQFKFKTHHAAIPLLPKRFIRKQVEAFKPDLIHVHHPFLLGALGSKVGKEFGIPVVFTYHTQYEQFPLYLPIPKALSSHLIAKRVVGFCNQVDGIVAVGRVVTNFLTNHQVKTPVIELASGLQEHFLVPFSPKKIKSPFKLLLVTRFSQEKNIPFLIDVLSELPEQFTLTLVGFGPLFEAMQQYARDQGVTDRTSFIHKPSKEQLVNAYQGANLFLFSAQQSECQPQVLPEAFAAGLPIVALPGPGPSECIDHGNNGYLVHSRDEMAATIHMIAENPPLYSNLRHQAWQSAQQYHPARQVEKLVDFYLSVIF